MVVSGTAVSSLGVGVRADASATIATDRSDSKGVAAATMAA
jgi:hypothetical protein